MKFNSCLLHHIIHKASQMPRTETTDLYMLILEEIHTMMDDKSEVSAKLFYYGKDMYANKKFINYLEELKNNIILKENPLFKIELDKLIKAIHVYEFSVPEIPDLPMVRVGNSIIISANSFYEMQENVEKENLMKKVNLEKSDYIKLLSRYSLNYKIDLFKELIKDYISGDNDELLSTDEKKVINALGAILEFHRR